MQILISPAKSLSLVEHSHKLKTTVPYFEKEINQLISKLQKLSVKGFESMMHISKDLAVLNYERFQNWSFPYEANETNSPAVLTFTGEVYRGLDANSLTDEDLLYAQEKLRILSGLYGVLRPLDLMYPYRLEMGTKFLVTPKLKNLYLFWGEKVANFLNAEAKNDEVIINLASTEYFKVIPAKSISRKVITPIFKDFKNGTYKVVMMYAKHQRGAMARYIIENRTENIEELKLYNGGGYQYDVNLSSETEWVFTR
jgi:uncharacterized protein